MTQAERVNYTRIELFIPIGAFVCLKVLAEEGILGYDEVEVAEYLIMRAIDDLQRSRGNLQ